MEASQVSADDRNREVNESASLTKDLTGIPTRNDQLLWITHRHLVVCHYDRKIFERSPPQLYSSIVLTSLFVIVTECSAAGFSLEHLAENFELLI